MTDSREAPTRIDPINFARNRLLNMASIITISRPVASAN